MIKRIVLPGTRLMTLIGRKKLVIYCLFDVIKKLNCCESLKIILNYLLKNRKTKY
ncbi:MAG: hypothetical protein Q8764_01020 [Pigeon pea little leaf phytoplasma]|nr:hypothetical protein [Pigeon pea little leaf phytoplasma]